MGSSCPAKMAACRPGCDKMPPPLQNLSVRRVLGIEPDTDGVFAILHWDELGIALRGEGVKRGDEVQFILAGGKEGINDLHGDFDFDLGLLGILLVEDMNDQVVALLGDANVAIIALYGDELAAFGGADSLAAGAEVDVIPMSLAVLTF